MSKAEDEIVALKQATREAHEAIKGLKEYRQILMDACREFDERMSMIVTATRGDIEELISVELTRQVECLAEATNKSIKMAEERVGRRLDAFVDQVLGEDRRAKATGAPTLAELAESAQTIRRLRRLEVPGASATPD